MHFKRLSRFALTGFAVVALPAGVRAQQPDVSRAPVNLIRLTENMLMLMGAGGNIGVSIGDDGIFLVDDQYAPLTPKILAVLDSIDKRSVRFVLNTHWHGDHTGGNENMGKAGALIVAHDNVRKRMSVEQFIKAMGDTVPASPKGGLPVVTFNATVTFHLNDDEIYAFHVDPAHTDGDAVVWFKKSNVIHMGDLYFNGMYPFIDLSSGGSVQGLITAVDRIAVMINDVTRVIPGHGPLSNRGELKAYGEMLTGIRDNVRKLIVAKKTLQQTIAAKPSEQWDEKWGKGFMKPDKFVESVYESLVAERAKVRKK
ncbi:MAG: MBL fold metallo-hydrolase [Gemmatimonadaceae bacterium]|nr:MBL fold metallo-hydrolase [Gemmatimonadaceae bacterium]MDQ3519168.1 MBL fold metallo-hydrolase [Gemmatimonadota bacterium]